MYKNKTYCYQKLFQKTVHIFLFKEGILKKCVFFKNKKSYQNFI